MNNNLIYLTLARYLLLLLLSYVLTVEIDVVCIKRFESLFVFSVERANKIYKYFSSPIPLRFSSF